MPPLFANTSAPPDTKRRSGLSAALTAFLLAAATGSPAFAHDFGLGGGYYADFLAGCAAVLTELPVLICLASAGIFIALWNRDGFPGVWPLFALGNIAGMLLAYAVIWPDRQVLLFFVIPVKMKWLILGLFAFVFLFALGGSFETVVLYSGGALAGALYLFYHARRGRVMAESGFRYEGSTRSSSVSGGIGDRSKEKKSGGLFGWLEDRKKKKRLKKKQEEIDRRISMKEEVDRLLEKISRDGMDSLSRKEKAFLDKASREF